MAKGIGRRIQVGIAKETTRGTAESSATYWAPFSEAEVVDKDEKVIADPSRGIIEDSEGQEIVSQWAEASITAPLTDKHFGLILLAAFGGLSTGDNADSDASVKDHAFTVSQSAQHQALTLFLDDPIGGQDYSHALGVLNSLEISYERNQFVQYVANFMAKKGATATLSPASTSESRFLPQHLSLKLASNLSGLDAATAIPVKSLKINIEKNVEKDDVLGSLAPADFLNKQFTVTGELEAIWQNESDFKTAALAGTAKAMRIDLVNTGVTIGNSANPRFKLDLAKVIFSEFSNPIRVNDVMMQTLTFKASYSISDSSMISALLTNTVASY